MRKQFILFLTRTAANYAGLAISAYAGILTINGGVRTYIIGALLLAVLNAIVKPLLIIISLPLIAVTVGLFLIIINGVVLYILSFLYLPLEINNFWWAMVAGIVIGLVNYIVTIIYERLVSDE